MKLLHFTLNNDPAVRLGIQTADGVIDLTGMDGLPTTLEAVMEAGKDALTPALSHTDDLIDEADINYAPCVLNPEKILCVGLNYARHAKESGADIPTSPVLFSKFNNTLASHGEDIPLPTNAEKYDYEVELGVIIGKTARYVSEEDALDYVFGYCTIDDLSVRDLQMRTSQWLLGKTMDKFMPMGPYIVTADEVADPQNLGLSCWVNGERRQNSNTSDMIFSVAQVISYASQYMTLKAGDIISTGTPEGVVLGMNPQVWLQPGDEATCEIEGLGKLTNRFVAE
ncbi:MAG: fumarylacetoacetate hydrolase family protein [Aggregatilineales bacterium]